MTTPAPSYSIVYVVPNRVTNDRIGVGLWVLSEGRSWFNFDASKAKMAASLLGKTHADWVLSTLSAIKANVHSVDAKNDSFFSQEIPFINRMSYLSANLPGFIEFGTPTPYEATRLGEEALFNFLISYREIAERVHSVFSETVSSFKRNESAKNAFDIDFSFKTERVPSLINNVTLDAVTVADAVIAVKAIDLTTKSNLMDSFYRLEDLYYNKAKIEDVYSLHHALDFVVISAVDEMEASKERELFLRFRDKNGKHFDFKKTSFLEELAFANGRRFSETYRIAS